MKIFPETLESFNLQYYKKANLEETLNIEGFVKGLIFMGVHNFTFNNIDFSEEANITSFTNIFSKKMKYSQVKYLNFYKCNEVYKLDNFFLNPVNLETLSFSHCEIKGKIINLFYY